MISALVGAHIALVQRDDPQTVGFGFGVEERPFDRTAAHQAGQHIRNGFRRDAQRLADRHDLSLFLACHENPFFFTCDVQP